MISGKRLLGVFLKYEEVLKDLDVYSPDFNNRFAWALMQRSLEGITEEELEKFIIGFRSLANYYILKMQGVNVD